MKLILDQENLIIGYELLGGSNGYEIEQKDLPDDFLKNYRAKKFMLSGDAVVLNPHYQEPTISIPEPQPSAEQQAITDLAINSAEHDQHIQSIEEAITALAQSQMGGTN